MFREVATITRKLNTLICNKISTDRSRVVSLDTNEIMVQHFRVIIAFQGGAGFDC